MPILDARTEIGTSTPAEEFAERTFKHWVIDSSGGKYKTIDDAPEDEKFFAIKETVRRIDEFKPGGRIELGEFLEIARKLYQLAGEDTFSEASNYLKEEFEFLPTSNRNEKRLLSQLQRVLKEKSKK